MRLKRIMALILALCMVLSTMSFTVFAESEITVDSADAFQTALDEATDGTTIRLTTGVDYGTVKIRPVDGKANTITGTDYHSTHRDEYVREVENLTIVGADGATVDGIEIVTGTQQNSIWYYADIKNLVIDSVTFTEDTPDSVHTHDSPLLISLESARVDGLTVTGCVMDGGNGGQNFVYIYGSQASGSSFETYSKNVTIKNNTVENVERLCELRETENVTIEGNTVKNTKQHAVLLACNAGKTYSGDIAITNNTADGIGERFVRMAGAGDATVTVADNTVTTYNGADIDFIKVTDSTSAGICSIVDNTLDGEETVVENVDGTYKVIAESNVPTVVATVNGVEYTDIQEAIKAAAPAGTVDIINDVVVDEWKMFWQGDRTFKDIIFIDMDGLTIDGHGHTLTVNNIVSSSNGNQLFKGAKELNVNNWTINVVNGAGGIGLEAGTIDKVTFNGGTYGIYPGSNGVTINECTFNNLNGTSIQYDYPVSNLTVTKNTFNSPGKNAIILRENETFTGNSIVASRGVTVSSTATALVSNNTFADGVRIKVYNDSTATITDNTLSVIEFEDNTAVKAVFTNNTLSSEAKNALNGAGVLSGVGTEAEPYLINDLADLKAFRDNVNNGISYKGKYVQLTSDIDLNNEEWTPIGKKDITFQGTFDGDNHTIFNLQVTSGKSYVGFFGFTTNGEVKNLKIHNATVKGYTGVGAFAGSPYTSKMTNLTLTGDVVIEGLAYVGGMLGRNLYADATDLTVDVNAGSYVKAISTEDGTRYRTYVGGVIGFMGEGSHSVKNVTSNIDVIGDVMDIGGIVGIIHYGNSFINVSCSGDVTMTSGEPEMEIGGIAGTWMNNDTPITLDGLTYTGTLSATLEDGTVVSDEELAKHTTLGANYNKTNSTENFIKAAKLNGNYYTLQDALAAAQSGDTIYLLADVTIPADSISIDDGNGMHTTTAVKITEGITLDGGNHTLIVSAVDGTNTWASAVYMSGGALKDITIEGGNRGVLVNRPTEDITLDGVSVSKSLYALNTNAAAPGGAVKLTVTNSTFNGWSSISNASVSNAVFTDCAFGESKRGGGLKEYAYMRSYTPIVLDECTFATGYDIDTSRNLVTIKDCNIDGTDISVDTIASIAENAVAAIEKNGNIICYDTLQKAFDAAVKGDVIEIVRDFTVTEQTKVTNPNALDGVTLDGNGHTISAGALDKNTTSILYFGDNGANKVWCNNVTIKDLTIDAESARFALMFYGGNVSTLENVTIKGDYYYAINLYGTCGATLTDCDIVTVFTNAQDANPLTLVNTKIGKLYANKSDVKEDKAKVYIDANSSVEELYFWGESTEMIDSLENVKSVKTAAGENTVAQLGKIQYATLPAAVNAAKAGETITIIADFTNNEKIEIAADKNLVLDLNGKTVKGHIVIAEGATVEIKNGSIIGTNGAYDTIKSDGNLTLTNVNADGERHIVRAKKGTVTINGGTYTYTGSATGTRHVINIGDYDKGQVVSTATATINGGTFIGPKGTSADSGSAVLVQNGSAVTINDGTFKNGKNSTLSAKDGATLLVKGGVYDQDPAAYVVDGFVSSQNADGSYSVVAEREILVSADKPEVVADEEVVITVSIKGEGLANAKWKLTYDKSKFALQNGEDNGVIEGHDYKTAQNEVYASGDVLATYTFKALAQAAVTEGDFVLSDTYAYAWIESFDGTKVAAKNNEKVTVKINLKNYTVVTKVDGNEVTGTSFEFPYDDAAHTFEVVTDAPAKTIEYKVNGEAVTAVSLDKEGEYTIAYKVVPELGYAEVTGTYTVKIGKPDYKVEVNLTAREDADYVSGKKIVLVYTNTDNVFFNYDNSLMIDVTKRGYKYEGTTEYKHVFAFVTDAIANGTLADYEAKVAHLYAAPGLYTIAQYDMDLNFDTENDIRDITTVYGVYNVNTAAFANIKYQKNILKADTDGNKCVNGVDANAVAEAIYPTTK